jgi:predicted amidohydrolase
MSRKIKIAAVQMDANYAPVTERLRRAERLIKQIAPAEADLVVLPELFNTGYGYTPENFQRAEPLSGQTVTWLKETAAKYHIHLAGSLMLRERQDIYNALFLFAPDGRMWRYDKSYPWGWERAYFRGRKGITIAETDLGDIGLMICWDAAHRNLWRQYAGRVNLMIISSCPPDVTKPTFVFENGERATLDDFGRVGKRLQNAGRLLFGEMVNQQTAWLGVPTVQTVGSGHLQTRVPNSLWSLVSFLPLAPKLAKYLPQGNAVRLACDFVPGCKIVDGEGNVQAALEQAQGETFAIAEVVVPEKAKPKTPQPKSLLPKIAYLASDVILPLLMLPIYRRGVRQVRR